MANKITPINRRQVALNRRLGQSVGALVSVFALATNHNMMKTIDPYLMQQFLLVTVLALVALKSQQQAFASMEYRIIKHVVEVEFNAFYLQQNVGRKKRLRSKGIQEGTNKKRRVCRHDHDRARKCCLDDWLGKGPEPNTFTDRQFEETFRVTKGHVERMMQACAKYEPKYFNPSNDCTGKPGIIAEVKVINILKAVAYGCSPRAFMDYSQMGVNTTTEYLKAFFRAILADDELHALYLREPTPEDVRNICDLHAEQHGVEGFLLSLDCVHIWWKNCPVAWQGQFKNGKNKMASLVMEVGSDYNSFMWSISAGHAGTNNDTNNWDVSPLLAAFLSQDFNDRADFTFTIDGEEFHLVWCLVDGIYPAIARFVKTLHFPNDDVARIFAKWQEAARKDSERSFGILFRKFQHLTHPIEYWHFEDVRNQLYGCCMMHNMMVVKRVERGERDDASMYRLSLQGKAEAIKAAKHLQTYVTRSLIKNPSAEDLRGFQEAQLKRFRQLYDEEEHIRLQCAVMNQVARNSVAHKRNRVKKYMMV